MEIKYSEHVPEMVRCIERFNSDGSLLAAYVRRDRDNTKVVVKDGKRTEGQGACDAALLMQRDLSPRDWEWIHWRSSNHD